MNHPSRTLWRILHQQTEFTGMGINFTYDKLIHKFHQSQGPVQFPTDTNDYNENALQDLPHPYERLALKSRTKARQSARRLDYVRMLS